MVRRSLTTLVLAVLAVASLDAELKYTVQMTSHKLENAQPGNPMIAMLGQSVMQQMLPSGKAEMVYIVGERGIRTEFTSGGMGQAAGSVTILLPSGDMYMLNPTAKTYWKTTMAQAASLLQQTGVKPEFTLTRTGEMATHSGLRTEKVTMQMSMPLPIPPEALAQLPPGFPTAIAMEIDNWMTVDTYKNYALMAARGNTMLTNFGIDPSKMDGVTMRSLMRSDMFGAMEIESLVTAIGEESVPASMFEVPADYKQVAGPGGIGG